MRNTRCSLVSVDSWRSRSSLGLLAVSGLALVAIGCGSDDNGGADSSTGGVSAAVGGSGTGGASSTGGSSTSTGGGSAMGTGGSGTGGTSGNTGGTSSNTGGTSTNTGGFTSNTGGTSTNTGGMTASTGGETAAGGSPQTTGGTTGETGGTTTGETGGTTTGETGGTTGETGGTTGETGGTTGETGGTTGGDTGGTAGVIEVPTLVGPIERSGNTYVFEFGDLYFEVDADVGARIVSFSLGDTEILSSKSRVSGGDDTMKNNYGSTFWTSPQTDWNWPPIAAHDSEPYTQVSVDETSFTLESDSASVGGKDVSIVKKFTAELAENRIRIDYTIRNEGSSSAQFAPWEVGRVTSGGLTFFPTGPDGTRTPTMTEMDPSESGGITWLDWTGSGPSAESKYICDGAEGWLAHAQDGALLMRTFVDIPLSGAASGEADVELYANTQYEYVETEPQGALASIPGGEETTWTVYWQLVAIPEEVTVEEGSETLATFARSVAALAPVSG